MNMISLMEGDGLCIEKTPWISGSTDFDSSSISFSDRDFDLEPNLGFSMTVRGMEKMTATWLSQACHLFGQLDIESEYWDDCGTDVTFEYVNALIFATSP